MIRISTTTVTGADIAPMDVTLFFGLVIMILNDVTRRHFRLAYGKECHHGLDFVGLLVVLFCTAHVLFSPSWTTASD